MRTWITKHDHGIDLGVDARVELGSGVMHYVCSLRVADEYVFLLSYVS